MTEFLPELVKLFEVYVGRVYPDATGIPTIGYGHVLTRSDTWYRPGFLLTEPAASRLLQTDLEAAQSAVLRILGVGGVHGSRPYADCEVDALTSFTFNVGGGAFAKSTLLRLYCAGDVTGAADQFKRWVFADGKVLGGLVRRRRAEAALFRGASPETVKATYERSAT